VGAWKNASILDGPVRGVVGRAVGADRYELRRWAPSPRAARYLEHFWSVRWDLPGGTTHDSTVLSFPVMHLTREWGEDGVRHGFALPATLVHGVVPRVFRITLRERGWVLGARFRPGGFAARFGCDASTLSGRVVPLSDGLPGVAIDLDDDMESALARLDEFVGAGPDEPDPVIAALTGLVARIRDDGGMQRVEQVVERAPWSARTTQRVFRRYVGVPVKWVLCRYRLQQAALEIETDPTVDFAALAVRLGWYDQAHFINDFRDMLGCTPGEYAARYAPPR